MDEGTIARAQNFVSLLKRHSKEEQLRKAIDGLNAQSPELRIRIEQDAEIEWLCWGDNQVLFEAIMDGVATQWCSLPVSNEYRAKIIAYIESSLEEQEEPGKGNTATLNASQLIQLKSVEDDFLSWWNDGNPKDERTWLKSDAAIKSAGMQGREEAFKSYRKNGLRQPLDDGTHYGVGIDNTGAQWHISPINKKVFYYKASTVGQNR